ncbi:MAG: hypothetical protein ACW9W3_02715 [Candidatus Nitrosopumilus sp. bin_68KS]
MKERVPFRAWYYFRQGWSVYFAFIFAAINTLTVTYYLAIENYPLLSNIFPTFFHYIAIVVLIGVPLLVGIGYTHYKKSSAYRSETGILYQTNPYIRRTLINSEMNLQINLELLKIIIKLSKNEKIEQEKLDEILKMEKKFIDYFDNRSFNEDTDLDILKKLQNS